MTVPYLDVQAYFYITRESFYWKQENFKVESPVIIWPSEVLLLMIMHESEKRKKMSWNSRSLDTAISACCLLAGGAKLNNLLLQRIRILKYLSYFGDGKINRICPNESYFMSRNYFFLTNTNILVFIPLRNPCSQKGQDFPSFSILHSIGVYYPTHKLVTIIIDHHV